ncbi:hypothetical protein, partial [Acinetobacter baumannii]|uniref:hypothetical protein n=1 Tax=Acinetobacter baumannii TaxID=470 RepID=UPI001C071306
MDTWHQIKQEKYHALCCEIRSKKWTVHFFAVEVGARGYCSESVQRCLRRLGFPNKLCKTTLKDLSLTSLKKSFEIWLSRNSKVWDVCKDSPDPPMKKAKKVRIEKNSLKQTVTLDTGKKIKHQRGFANKGN